MYTQKTCESIVYDDIMEIEIDYENYMIEYPNCYEYGHIDGDILVYIGTITNNNESIYNGGMNLTWNYITREIYAYYRTCIVVFDENGQFKRNFKIQHEGHRDHFIYAKQNLLFIPFYKDKYINIHRCSDGSHISTLYPPTDYDSFSKDIFFTKIYMNESLDTLFVRWNHIITAYDFSV